MTDLEKFKELYTNVGMEFTEHTIKTLIHIHTETGTEKVDGYYMFTTDDVFDRDGKFIQREIYE